MPRGAISQEVQPSRQLRSESWGTAAAKRIIWEKRRLRCGGARIPQLPGFPCQGAGSPCTPQRSQCSQCSQLSFANGKSWQCPEGSALMSRSAKAPQAVLGEGRWGRVQLLRTSPALHRLWPPSLLWPNPICLNDF